MKPQAVPVQALAEQIVSRHHHHALPRLALRVVHILNPIFAMSRIRIHTLDVDFRAVAHKPEFESRYRE